jgi:hypothetical protein
MRGHFPEMASRNLHEAFFPAGELPACSKVGIRIPEMGRRFAVFLFQRGRQAATKEVCLSGRPKRTETGNQVLETGKIPQSGCAWGQPFEAAPSERPLL